jgi:hypothetical protein
MDDTRAFRLDALNFGVTKSRPDDQHRILDRVALCVFKAQAPGHLTLDNFDQTVRQFKPAKIDLIAWKSIDFAV